jgi:hypothetical protein
LKQVPFSPGSLSWMLISPHLYGKFALCEFIYFSILFSLLKVETHEHSQQLLVNWKTRCTLVHLFFLYACWGSSKSNTRCWVYLYTGRKFAKNNYCRT